MLPKVGDKYSAYGPLVQRNKGISVGSEWILTCVEGQSISLSVFANNNNGFAEITIAKPFFGQNFKKIDQIGSPNRASTYKLDKHYYPEVNAKNLQLMPQ